MSYCIIGGLGCSSVGSRGAHIGHGAATGSPSIECIRAEEAGRGAAGAARTGGGHPQLQSAVRVHRRTRSGADTVRLLGSVDGPFHLLLRVLSPSRSLHGSLHLQLLRRSAHRQGAQLLRLPELLRVCDLLVLSVLLLLCLPMLLAVLMPVLRRRVSRMDPAGQVHLRSQRE